LQHQGDRPVRGGRPTLLTPDEQAAPGRQGILSSLDGMQGQAAAAPGPRPRSRALAWGGAAAGAIAVCGALFLFGGSEDRAAPVAAPVQVAAAPAAPAAPVTPVSLPAQVPAQAAPAPAPAVLRDEPAAPAGPVPNPLAEMAPPAAPARHKERSAKADKAERKEAHAKTAHAKAQDKSREKPREAGKEKRAKPGAREQDSDVVLLAALMSHMDPKKGKATPAEQLEACRRYNAAGEEQCRARVCATAGHKEAACKRVPAARADAES
jgi:type IV secretory pathway VirB10-like protein